MREFKFRAWDEDNKQMSEVFKLIHDQDLFDDQHIVMQYTGLHDKNGKEIYEGDVVMHTDLFSSGSGKPHQVVWDAYCFQVDGFYDSAYDYPNMGFSEKMIWEVIGNIYENPELLDNK